MENDNTYRQQTGQYDLFSNFCRVMACISANDEYFKKTDEEKRDNICYY